MEMTTQPVVITYSRRSNANIKHVPGVSGDKKVSTEDLKKFCDI